VAKWNKMEVEARTRRTADPSPRAPIAPACSSQMARPRARRSAACSLLALVLGIFVLPATRGDAPIAAGAQVTCEVGSKSARLWARAATDRQREG